MQSFLFAQSELAHTEKAKERSKLLSGRSENVRQLAQVPLMHIVDSLRGDDVCVLSFLSSS